MASHEKVLQQRDPKQRGSFKSLCTAAIEAIPEDLSQDKILWWNKYLSQFGKGIKAYVVNPSTLQKAAIRWKQFYQMLFGWEVSFTIPNDCKDFISDNCVFIPAGLTYPKIAKMLEYTGLLEGTSFPLDSVQDLHRSGGVTYRLEANKPYLIWIHPRDPESEYVPENHAGCVTFGELLIQQLFRYWNGDTLDKVQRAGLGSRLRVAYQIPVVNWTEGNKLRFTLLNFRPSMKEDLEQKMLRVID
jgi:hypothetical protein